MVKRALWWALLGAPGALWASDVVLKLPAGELAGTVDAAWMKSVQRTDYGSFSLLRVPAETYAAQAGRWSGAEVLRDFDQISVGGVRFDPLQMDAADWRRPAKTAGGSGLHLVQLRALPTESDLATLRSSGLRVLQYYPNNAYLVWGDEAAATRARGMPTVRWSGGFSPDWKLSPSLKGRLGKIDNVTVLIHDEGSLSNVLAQIEGIGGRVLQVFKAQPDGALMNAIVSIDAGQLALVNDLPQVLWTEYASPRAEFDDEMSSQIVAGNYNAAGQVTGTGYIPFITNLGLSGQGVTFAISDTGIDYDQPEFAGRIVGGHDYAGCTSAAGRPGDDKSTGGHGTHVAGIVGGAGVVAGGVDANGYHYGIGIAPQVNLVALNPICGGAGTAWPPAGGWQELSRRALLLGAMGSNNSWFTGASGAQGYSAAARTHDFMIRDGDFDTPTTNQPFLMVFSAGNAGSAASTITEPKEAKNIISTGNSLNQRQGSINAMAGSSSRGPALDGRVLPTVTAPGSQIASTRRVAGASQCGTAIGTGAAANYAFCTGTSMASPQVAGLAVLLTQWWRQQNAGATPSPAMLKALLTNGAVDMSGPGPIPNNDEGWGRIHLPGSLATGRQRAYIDQSERLDNIGQVFERTYGVPDSGQGVRITLAWTDAPGAAGANPALVNNLDLEVVAGGQTYRGNVFTNGQSATGGSADNRNNLESVYLPAGVGAVTVRVIATALPGDGVPNSGDATDQDFALVCTNCALEPSFSVSMPSTEAAMCAGASMQREIALGQILGFASPVTMSASGLPAPGVVSFTPNPVTALPGTTMMSVNTTGVAAGNYALTAIGTSGSLTRSSSFPLFLATAPAVAATLTAPANNASNVAIAPTFTWAAAAQAYDYQVQVASDAGFTNIVAQTTTRDTSWTPTQPLNSGSSYFWRVIARNPCPLGVTPELFADGFEPAVSGGGSQAVSSVQSFATQSLPGDCPVGATVTSHYNEGFEAAGLPSGWSQVAGGSGTNSWAVTTAFPQTGTRALQGLTPASVSDQRVQSAEITIPTISGGTQSALLTFWQRQNMERRTAGGCWDGGVIELCNAGGTCTAVTALNLPYDGALTTPNPAAPTPAWCGDPRPYGRTAVNVSSFIGQTLRIRFRVTSDDSVNRPEGWNIDNLEVKSCNAP